MAGRSHGWWVTSVVQACCRQLWGFSPAVIAGVVQDKGPLRSLLWFIANMPRYLTTMRVLGPVRTHLACATISLNNGCAYCAFGQAYALELIYLRDTGRLFPLDVNTLSEWLDLEPRQLGAQLRGVLREAGLHSELVWVDLTLAFAAGEQQPIDDDEVRLAHLVRMISEMNRIADAIGAVPDGAQDAVNKDVGLKARHAALRHAAATG
jgi:hypothetical protein